MKEIKCIVVLFMMTISGFSYGASGGTGWVDIHTVRAGGGFLRVTGVTNFVDPSNCDGSGNNTRKDVLIMETTPSYKEIVSLVIAAKMANEPVQFWVNGCQTDSGNSFPNVLYVYFRN